MKHRHAIAFLAGLALPGLALPGLALAHHSGAMFDSTRSVTISGTVTEFNWVNPHSSFKVEVTGADGAPVIWAIEMNSPQNLIPTGWKRTTIKSGDKVSVTVRPLRDGKPGGSYMSIKLADGRVLNGDAGAGTSVSVGGYSGEPAKPR